MSLNDFIIDHGSKKKDGYLDTAYRRFVFNKINSIDETKLERWEVYNMIANELVGHGYIIEFDELRYRITDNENPNDVIIDILDNIECTTLLRTLYGMVEMYIGEDFHSEFIG
jgi:hypothetical protein